MYRIFYFVCLLAFSGCSLFFEDSGTSSDDHKWRSATSHGSSLDVYLAIYCPRDMSCRSTLQLDGTPKSSKSYTWGFHYTFIGGNDTLIAEDDLFIDGTDSVRSWNLPVTDRHVRFSLLDDKKKHKDYDIDLSPWMGEVSRGIPFRLRISMLARMSAFTNFRKVSVARFWMNRNRLPYRTIPLTTRFTG